MGNGEDCLREIEARSGTRGTVERKEMRFLGAALSTFHGYWDPVHELEGEVASGNLKYVAPRRSALYFQARCGSRRFRDIHDARELSS